MSVSHSRRKSPAPPAPQPRRSALQSLVRFVRTPKGTLLLILVGFSALGMVGTHWLALPGVLAAVIGAAVADLAAARLRHTPRAVFPSGALISGLLVALVLAPQTSPYVLLLVAVVAVALKHALRTRWSNIFNPATLALIVCGLVFRSGQSWWGALPTAGIPGFALVLAAGWYLAARVNKVPLVLAFLTTALAGFAAASFLGASAQVAQVFRAPDINALFFFAGFMLIDPPTSPARPGHQVWFGLVVGAVSVAAFLKFGVQWFIIAGLPVGNLVESLRRLGTRPAAARAGRAGTVGGAGQQGPRGASPPAATRAPASGPARPAADRALAGANRDTAARPVDASQRAVAGGTPRPARPAP